MPEWHRVNRKHPCSVCGKADWCGVSPDGVLACCMRVKSGRPARNGGWLHRIADVPLQPAPRARVRQPPRAAQVRDWASILARWAKDTTSSDIAQLGRTLGVTAASLARLGACCTERHRAWAFPMRDAACATIGIRLRARTGRKWAVRGSRNGLFWPHALSGTGPLLVCEGPTDVAALLDLGYDAIGRPSCAGAVEMTVDAIGGMGHHDVVVIADADGPGVDGAERLARALTEAGHHLKVIQPRKGKDARAWLQAGATRADVDGAIRDACYWRPHRGG